MMTFSAKKWSRFVVCAAVLAMGANRPVQAQAASGGNVTASTARFSVDIKDATLMDALQLVFTAANERNYTIDASAKSVRVGTLSFKDQPWRDIVRTLASLNKFRFARLNGVWVVEPRANVTTSANAGFGTSTRSNARQSGFTIETRGSAQIGGSGVGSGTGGSSGSGSGTATITILPTPSANQSASPWSIIEPNHIYVGTIAGLFQGGTVLSTIEVIVPRIAYSGTIYGGFKIQDLVTGFSTTNNNNNNNNNQSGNTNR